MALILVCKDIASPEVLARYEKMHRAATRPLFLATHIVAKLYSDDRFPAKVLRNIALRAGSRISPFRRAIAKSLTAVR